MFRVRRVAGRFAAGAGAFRAAAAFGGARGFGARVARAMGVGAFAVLAACSNAEPARAQDWRTVTSSRGAGGVHELDVDVEYGAGELRVQPGTTGMLYRSALRYDSRGLRPVTRYKDGRLRLGLEGQTKRLPRSNEEARLDLTLGPDVPLDISLHFGAVEADIELGGLRVRDFQLATGASETKLRFSEPNREVIRVLKLEAGAAALHAIGLGNANADRLDFDGGVGDIRLDFTGAWQRDMHAKIDMGLGSLTLILPRDLGVRFTKDSFLVSFDSQGLTKRGNAYYSGNWETAARKLTVDFDGALGSIEVRWVDGVAGN